jgi:hypothetical protein
MPNDRPDPADFLEMAQKMLRQLFDPAPRDDESPDEGNLWASATRRGRESFTRERQDHREPSPEKQRENLTFALATRAVEALEDLALNVAAIRQRLERSGPQATADRPETSPETSEE